MSGYQYLPTSGHVVLRREVPLVEFAAQHLAPECWPAEVPSDVDLAAVCDHEVALASDSGPFPLAYVAINTEDPNDYFYVYRIDSPSGVFTYGNTKGRPALAGTGDAASLQEDAAVALQGSAAKRLAARYAEHRRGAL